MVQRRSASSLPALPTGNLARATIRAINRMNRNKLTRKRTKSIPSTFHANWFYWKYCCLHDFPPYTPH